MIVFNWTLEFQIGVLIECWVRFHMIIVGYQHIPLCGEDGYSNNKDEL